MKLLKKQMKMIRIQKKQLFVISSRRIHLRMNYRVGNYNNYLFYSTSQVIYLLIMNLLLYSFNNFSFIQKSFFLQLIVFFINGKHYLF